MQELSCGMKECQAIRILLMALREDALKDRWGKELMPAVCLKSSVCSSTNARVDSRGFQTLELMELAGHSNPPLSCRSL